VLLHLTLSAVFDQKEAALAAEAAELRQQHKEILSHCVDLEKVLIFTLIL
jgi:hypothetical protein